MAVGLPDRYKPGTRLPVGSHQVTIIKYISEGGFAHVYTCKMDPPFHGSEVGCLKRVVVPNKWELNLLRQEVDAMKRLKGNEHIVSYIDSHASRLNNPLLQPSLHQQQQYEVFLLMEYCSRNGLIDFMNTRLTNKLSEPEILKIMHDITIGVAMCHHLRPPLIHRDIKIENVLIDSVGTYKLCDFGSAVGYIAAPRTPQELKIVHDDIMQHTTPQYRAPEMIDLSRGFPVDDKLDIWALGCFLFKLCYYTTPFELPKQTSLHDLEASIFNSSETLHFPPNCPGSMFSSRLKNVIKCCLREDPRKRPNAVQLLEEICLMQGITKIPDVTPYTVKVAAKLQKISLPSTHDNASVPKVPVKASTEPPQNSKLNYNIAPKKADPFASIDKSKFLSPPLVKQPDTVSKERPKSLYAPKQLKTDTSHDISRPLSVYSDEELEKLDDSSTPYEYESSAASIKNYVQQKVSESSNELRSVHSNNDIDGTINFLKNKEEETQKLSNLRQSTGGSFKMSIKNGLRKISTGGSNSGSAGPYLNGNLGSNRRSSSTSLKQLFSGNSARKASHGTETVDSFEKRRVMSDEKDINADKTPRRKSIQGRMAMLVKSLKNDLNVSRTANGYGRFTENDSGVKSPIPIRTLVSPPPESHKQAIREPQKMQEPRPPKVPAAISSHTRRSLYPSKNNTQQEKHAKKPPPKPVKPTHLQSDDMKVRNDRRASNSSAISMPDLDDLEKQFAKKFPSYV